MVVDGLSVVAAVETCFTMAKELYKYIERMVRWQVEVGDISFRFEDHNTVLGRFVEFFKKEEKWINEDDRRYLKRLFEKIGEDLRKTDLKIQKELKGRIFDRLVWPFIGDYLKYAEQELAYWVQALNLKFTLLPDDVKQSMIAMVTSSDYQKYKQPLSGLITSVQMQQAKEAEVPKAQLLKLKKSEDDASTTGASGPPLSIYRKDLVPNVFPETEIEVARLVHVLRKADPSQIHIPVAKYYFLRGTGDLGIVYQWPENVKVGVKQPTLKDLVGQKLGHPLNDRLRIAREIVSAVAYVHAVGWVHKTIESNNIIIARHHSDSPNALGHVNLIGFSYARRQGTKSTGPGNYDWKTEIYRHPKRQRLAIFRDVDDNNSEATTLNQEPTAENAELLTAEQKSQEDLEYFKEKHDVYSIGVVLLELGLWKNLEEFEAQLHNASPVRRKMALTERSETDLPKLVGQKYEKLVGMCLQVDHTGISAQEVLQELEDIRL